MIEFYEQNSHLVNLIGINAILALSLYITLSCAMLSLSNAASAAIGAYTSAVLTTGAGWGLWPAVAAGAALSGLVALALGLPVLRLRGVFLAIATIGFGELVRIGLVNLTITGGAEGIDAIPRRTLVWHIWLAVAVCGWIVARIGPSRLGRSLAALRS